MLDKPNLNVLYCNIYGKDVKYFMNTYQELMQQTIEQQNNIYMNIMKEYQNNLDKFYKAQAEIFSTMMKQYQENVQKMIEIQSNWVTPAGKTTK